MTKISQLFAEPITGCRLPLSELKNFSEIDPPIYPPKRDDETSQTTFYRSEGILLNIIN